MKTRLLHQVDGLRTFVAVLDKEEDPRPRLDEFAAQEGIGSASLTAVGAFSSAIVGYFDPDEMDYLEIPVGEQVEVLSLIGDVAVDVGGPAVHAHVVLGRRDGTTVGGHLLHAAVWPTLEVIITETPATLQKKQDDESGLTLIDLRPPPESDEQPMR